MNAFETKCIKFQPQNQIRSNAQTWCPTDVFETPPDVFELLAFDVRAVPIHGTALVFGGVSVFQSMKNLDDKLDVHGQLKEMRGESNEMRGEINEMRGEMKQNKSDLQKLVDAVQVFAVSKD